MFVVFLLLPILVSSIDEELFKLQENAPRKEKVTKSILTGQMEEIVQDSGNKGL
jgi:hypothetical protein